MDKFIVLRDSTPGNAKAGTPSLKNRRVTRGRPMAKSRSDDDTDVPSFKVEVLDQKELNRLSRTEKPLAARAMPVKLISPKGAGRSPGSQGNIAWGVKAVKADTSPFDGSGLKVAVLDTGIDRQHVAFSHLPANQLIEKDFTGEGVGDSDGHGTHCAGTIFGGDVNGVRIGIAKGVRDVLIGKVIGKDGGSSDKIVEAMQWAVEQGANIISMSLGIDFPGYVAWLIDEERLPNDLAASRALADYRANVKLFNAIANLIKVQSLDGFKQPMAIIAAAGNESRLDERDDYEIEVSPPAVAEGIISVAAIGQHEGKYFIAPFTNSNAVLAAPGVDIVSAKAGGGLYSEDGTSMAAPHVAGVAALWMQKLTKERRNVPRQLTSLLETNCDRFTLPSGREHLYGWGLVQAPQ